MNDQSARDDLNCDMRHATSKHNDSATKEDTTTSVQSDTYNPYYRKLLEQRARKQELPEVLEDDGDGAEASRTSSRRVNCYIPWDLSRAWENRHRTARSASILLQEAIRAELGRTSLPLPCPGCGHDATYEGHFSLGGAEGESLDLIFELYRCANCGKCHSDSICEVPTQVPFDPKALEDYEVWRHDVKITWVEKGAWEPTEYDKARAGLLCWVEATRAREDGPDTLVSHEALEGRRAWDELMLKWVLDDRPSDFPW